MLSAIIRTTAIALIAASAAAMAVLLVYSRQSALSLEMDRDLPRSLARG